jgi:long-chain acyl-CoA synthetase
MNWPASHAMKFCLLEHPPQAAAVVDAHTGARKTYAELRSDVERTAAATPKRGRKSLGLLLAQNRYECIVGYLAALNSGDALLVVDATLNRELLLELVATYRPDFICAASSDIAIPGYGKIACDRPSIWERQGPEQDSSLHPSLGLLLNTSGSTGSPKLVRLSPPTSG